MAAVTTPTSRLVSLDAFRGLTIAFMVLVNTPGDGDYVYAPLRHAEWHGWTPTDVVFPSFMWIAGLAMTLSFARRLESGASRPELMWQALRRSLILYALGLLVYAYPDFDLPTLRLMGVLQRIAICTCAASAIWLTTGVRGRIAWVVALLSVYWALMMLVPVPGYGAGRLDVDGNFAHYVDRIVLGRHNYESTVTWDPEGIVSTLPARTWQLRNLRRFESRVPAEGGGISIAAHTALWRSTTAACRLCQNCSLCHSRTDGLLCAVPAWYEPGASHERHAHR
jgi:predicted acyltransferase